MEMMQRWWRWKFGFSDPSSQSETEQWSNNDGDESLAIPLSQLRNGTKAGADDAAAGSKVHSLDFDLCCSEMALIYVVLIDFDLCCSETAKMKYLPPCAWFILLRNDLKLIKFAIFPQGKTKDGVDTKEIMKRRRERAICIVSALSTIQSHV